MRTVLNYDDSQIRGHLEVVKIYQDGREEVHYSEDNVITSGMGYTLLQAFSNPGSNSISGYQMVYFQLGTGGSAPLQVSGTGELGTHLSEANYGTANFQISTHDLSSGTGQTGLPFGVIPFPYIPCGLLPVDLSILMVYILPEHLLAIIR